MLHSYLKLCTESSSMPGSICYIQLAVTFTLNFGVAISLATWCSYTPVDLSLNARIIHNTHGSYVAMTSILAIAIAEHCMDTVSYNIRNIIITPRSTSNT